MSPDLIEVRESNLELSSTAQMFLNDKIRKMEQIYWNPKVRERILDYLYNNAINQKVEFADFAVVFGTSLKLYRDKFIKRVYWVSMLLSKGKVKHIVFTGQGDHENDDIDQSADAMDIAVERFHVPRESISPAGGDNTQANIVEAGNKISHGSSIFLVSHSRHLIRAHTVAQSELGKKGVTVYVNPVGGINRIDPHHPATIIELVKAEAYHHTLYKRSDDITPDEHSYIRGAVENYVQDKHNAIKKEIELRNTPEESYEEWRSGLPEKYRIRDYILEPDK